MEFDAAIVRSDSLREFIFKNRGPLLKYYREVYESHRQLPVGSQNENGLKHGSFSLGLNAHIHPQIQQILNAYAVALFDYDLYTPELFFGVGKPVRPHNDVSLFLRAGQEVPIQLWILLESCVLVPGGARETGRRNALEVALPVAPGPVYAGTAYSLTPEGRQPLQIEETIGGDSLENGDALLFKNGCVHFTRPVNQKGLFRVALAVRAIRKARREDSNYLRWMKQLWEDDEQLRSEARGTYIYSAQRMLLDSVDDQPPDPAKLSKIDANDYGFLIQSMQTVNPQSAADAPLSYIEFRTSKSLER